VRFAEFDFDPYGDIATAEAGPWRWSSAKPQMHQFVRSYFGTRFEDGRPEGIASHPARVAGG